MPKLSQELEIPKPTHFDTQSTKQLASALGACLLVQRTYGKQGNDIDKIAQVFARVLAGYSPEATIAAIKKWLQESPEFPTPSDIIKILKANPDNATMKKNKYTRLKTLQDNGQYLNPDEIQFLRGYDAM